MNYTITKWSLDGKFKILCTGDSDPGDNNCGEGNKANYGESIDVIIGKISFNPKCNGSTAQDEERWRNEYTFSGSYYNIILED